MSRIEVVASASTEYAESVLLSSGHILDGRYAVIDLISQGGFAEVYRVRHLQLGAVRALKLLRVQDPNQHQRLLFEGRQLARLSHPNVLQVLDTVPHHSGVGLIMPLIAGATLHHHIQKGVPPLAEAIALGAGTLLGVAYAHQAGLIHRDLKPSNVLLAGQPGHFTPLVADFGLARFAQQGHQTFAGIAMGTPGYMPPEQYADASAVDHRADIFALGCILYELLSGQRAFQGDPLAALVRIQQGQVAPLRTLVPGLSPPLAEVVHAAMAAQPQQRPQTVMELLAVWAPSHPRVLPPVPELQQPAAPNVTLMPISADPRSEDSNTHPELSLLLEADQHPKIKAHLAGCVACRVALKSYQHYEESASLAAEEASQAPGNLSLPADRFVGREAERVQLEDLLLEARLVTLLGPGGAGKTRLALQFAAHHRRKFPGGVWFCDLSEARSTDDILRLTAQALQVPLVQKDPRAQLADAIAGHGLMLLILDNVEQVASSVAELVRTWLGRAPRCGILVTSRILLGIGGERVLPVTPLPLADAVQLFVERARAVVPDFSLSADRRALVEELVQRLDGLSLPIELAAARLQVFSLTQLQSRLSNRFRLLRSTRRDHPGRQSTMRAVIDWSWALLSPVEQSALAQCSIFRGGFDLTAVESVVALDAFADPPWPEDVLQVLLNNSLVQVVSTRSDTRRFQLLESIRDYAAEKLKASGQSGAVQLRHGRYYARMGGPEAIELFQKHGKSKRNWNISQDLENLIAAIDTLQQHGASTPMGHCAMAAAEIFDLVGPLQSGIQLIERVLRHDALSVELQSHLLRILSRLLYRIGRMEEAQAQCRASLDLAHAAGVDLLVGLARNTMGILLHTQGEVQQAQENYERAARLHRQIGTRRFEGIALSNLGNLLQQQGDRVQARTHFEAALQIQQTIGNRNSEGYVLGSLAVLCQQEGNLQEAQAHFEVALHIHRQTGNRHAEGSTLGNLAILCKERGEVQEAREHYEAALHIHRQTGNRTSEGIVLGNLGTTLLRLGRPREAKAHYEAALRIHRAVGNRRSEGIVQTALGSLAYKSGNIAEAQAHLEAALQLHRAVRNRMHEGVTLGNLGNLHQALGDLEAARESTEAALHLHRVVGNQRSEAMALSQLASLHRAQGDLATARQLLEAAIARIGDRWPSVRGHFYGNLAQVSFAEGAIDTARALLNRGEALLRGRDMLERAHLLCTRAELEAASGDPLIAQAAFDEAESLASQLNPSPSSLLSQKMSKLKQDLSD